MGAVPTSNAAAVGSVPRIPDQILQSVFYLYPTMEDAQNAERRGGCGFIVDVPNDGTGQNDRYAISNIHVVLSGCTFMRLNRTDGGTEVIEVAQPAWRTHSDGDDIAVAVFRPDNEADLAISGLQWKDLVGTTPEGFKDRMKELNVGIGDDVFMVGRFISHEGKQRNQPLARFGNIAMMPGEPVLDGRGLLVEAFLIEMRSLPGFSGSPVFLYVGPGSYRGNDTMMPFYEEQIGLLGIDTGHKMLSSEIIDKGTGKPLNMTWYVLQNTGVAIVAPVWRIRDVIDNGV
jgi:hypothetical protein